MGQENTAINDLIHLATAPKLHEPAADRESVEDLFWARNQVNLRGQRALESAPMPVVHAHAAPAPVMTMPMNDQVAGSARPASAGYMLTSTPSGGIPTAQATPGALHAARVAAARATVAKGGPAARVAAARAAAARSLEAQGASVATLRGVPSAAARAIAAQAVSKGTPAHGAAMRGVTPIFQDTEDDAATIRVDDWIPPAGADVRARLPAPLPATQRPAPAAAAAPMLPLAYAQPFAVAPLTDPTVRVTPLEIAPPSRHRIFASEFVRTVKRFAVPLALLMVVAVLASGYLAFAGQGGTPRPAASVVAAENDAAPKEVAAATEEPAPQPIVTPINEPNSVSAVIANKLAEARAAESLELANGAVVVDDAPEIEMEPVAFVTTKRTARSSSKSKSRKRMAAIAAAERKAAERRNKGKPAAKAKASVAKSADEAALPANVANKTDAANGKVSVTSNVPAMIYLDGRSTKMMTPKKFAVPAGKHKITLLEPSTKKAKTQDIEVVAGKTTAVEKQF